MPKVSIIVPVYNTQSYLEKCLDSLVNQTLLDIEIIIVNDGSPDNSQDIIDKYSDKYKDKIKAFTKPNGGLSDARNYGLKKSKGEYIGFLDSDDFVEKTMYEKLYNKAMQKNFEIVACNVCLVFENKDKTKKGKEEKKKVLNNLHLIESFDKKVLKENMITMYPVVWNKIYKREIILDDQNINNTLFKENIWYEDIEWMLRLYPKIKSIGKIEETLIYYLQRKDSITYKYNEKLYDFINNMKGIIDYYKEKNIYEYYKDELEYLFVRYALATFTKRLAKTKNKEIYKSGINYAIMTVNKYFPNYKKNKYLKKNGFKGIYIKYFGKTLAKINYLVSSKKKYN